MFVVCSNKDNIVCRIAAIPMNLSDLQDHSHIASLFKRYYSYKRAAVGSISTDIARRAVPLQ